MKGFLMKKSKILLLVTIFTIFGLMFSACEKDDDDDDNNPVNNNPSVADSMAGVADGLLADILFSNINSGEQDPGNMDVTGPYQMYLQAIALDSDNPHANFGAGVLELMGILQDEELMEMLMYIQEDPEFAFFAPAISSDSPFPAYSKDIFASNMSASFISDFDPEELPPFSPNDIQDKIRTVIIPKLELAISRLDIVTTHDDFTFIVSPEMQGNMEEDGIELDLTEIYSSLTLLNSILAVMNHAVAYNLDLGDYSEQALLDALTPGSSFAALNEDGVSRMSNAHLAWTNALNSLSSGIDFLENEEDDQSDDLIRIDPYDAIQQQDLDSLKAFLPTINDLLTSQATLGDGDSPFDTKSLHALYRNPVEDFKELLPGYSIEIVEDYDEYGMPVNMFQVTWDADTYEEWILPNPTINGFLPNMTMGEWRLMYGVPEGWAKTVGFRF